MVKFFFSNKYAMRFSEWLTTFRRQAKISQKTLAKELEKLGYQITDAQISNYEREYDKDKDGNPTRPPERFIELTAQIIGRPIDEGRTAAGYALKNDINESYEILDGATISFDERKFSKSEQAQFVETMKLIAAGVKAQKQK